MSNLYQNIKLLGTKAASKIALLKRTISEKNGTILSPDKMSTIPDEIRSILTLANSNEDILELLDTISMIDANITNFVYNEKTGIVVITFEGCTEYMMLDTKSGYYKYINLPINDDSSSISDTYVGDNVIGLFCLDKYIVMSFDPAICVNSVYHTVKALSWDNDPTSLVSGYVSVNTMVATFPWGGYGVCDDGQYIIDILNRRMYLSPNQNLVPDKMCKSIVLDNVTLLFRANRTDPGSLEKIFFVYNDDPFNIRHITCSNDILNNIQNCYEVTKTGKNTILIIGSNGTSNTVCAVELMVSVQEDSAIHLTHRVLDLQFAPDTAYHACTLGKYTFVNVNDTDIFYSDDLNEWQKVSSNYPITTMIALSDTFIVFNGDSDESVPVINRFYIKLVDSSDVPMHKVFLKNTGELGTGIIGNNHNSMHNSGRVCNLMMEDHILFSNKLIYDPREQRYSFSQVIYYENYFYFIFGFKKHFMLLKSKDGSDWDKVYETTNNAITFNPKNYNRWRLEVINGYLYLNQCDSVVGAACPIKINFNSDGSVSLEPDEKLIWNLSDRIPDTNLRYLYHACNGNIYGYYDADQSVFTDIYMIDHHGYTALLSEPIKVLSICELQNRDDGVLLLTESGFYLLLDDLIYKNITFDSLNVDLTTMKAFIYKDSLVLIQKSYDTTTPFIKFFTIKEDTGEVKSLSYSDLPSELSLYDRRDYLPSATIKDNLLFVRDCEANEPGFIIDLDDHFKFVRFEDSTTVNNHKFMQYCNGKMFVIDSMNKVQSSYTNTLDQEYDWVDMAGSNAGYFALCSTDNNLYFSDDGLSYSVLSEYGDLHYERVVAGGDYVIIYSIDGLTEKAFLSRDKGLTWENLIYPCAVYLQNAEMEKSSNGYEFVLFAKINETDPYNVIFKTYDYSTWEEISVNTYTNPINRQVWRDITCSPEGTWAAIGYDSSSVVVSTDGVAWQETVLPAVQKWSAVAFTEKVFFTVSKESDLAAYSEDGISWNPLKLPKKADWCGCAYGLVNGNPTVVVISNKSNSVLVGDSPFTLREYNNMPVYDWVRIIFQDNKFIAIARDTRYGAYSYDGITWNTFMLPLVADWRFLLYASGIFVLLDADCSHLATSINGIDWANEEIETDKTYRFIDYHNDKFIIFQFVKDGSEPEPDETGYIIEYVGTSDTIKEWITCVFENTTQTFGSKDGIIITRINPEDPWTDISLPLKDTDCDYEWLYRATPVGGEWNVSINHKNKRLLFCKNSNAYLYSEDDGKTWIRKMFPYNMTLTVSCGTYGMNAFILFFTDASFYLTSYDGITWRMRELPEKYPCTGVLYAKQKLYLYSDETSKYYISNNNIAWVANEVRSEELPWSKLIHDGNKFIGIHKNSDVYSTSLDGTTWVEDNAFDSARKYVDIFNNENELLVTTENENVLLFSPDLGETWNVVSITDSNELWTISRANDKYFLFGRDTNIAMVSGDGTNWTKIHLPIIGDWGTCWNITEIDQAATYNVPVPNSNQILYSYDGKYWYRSSHIDKLIYGNGFFVAVDLANENNEESTMFYSRDGLTWKVVKVELNAKLLDITFGDGKFMLITDDEGDFVFQSLNLQTWEKRYLNLVTYKKFIAYSLPGFSILTPSADVHFIDKDTQILNTELGEFRNQLIGSCGNCIFMLDYYTAKGYLAKDGDMSWIDCGFVFDNINDWKIRSLSSSIIVYGNSTMYIYSLYHDEWYTFNCGYSVVSSIEEVLVYNGSKNERIVSILAENQIYFISGLYNAQDIVSFDSTKSLDVSTLLSSDGYDPIKLCADFNHRSIKVITKDIIYDIFNINFVDYTYDRLDTPMDLDGNIIDIKITNKRFMLVTDTDQYYISYDGYEWVKYRFIDDMICTKIYNTNHYFVGYVYDDTKRYLFYTKNGIDITYQDFDELYGKDSDIAVTYDSLFIEKYDEYLTEVLFYNEHITLSASGSVDNKYDIINPKKTRFTKGNFSISEANEVKVVQLDFTPRMVIVRSLPKNSGEAFEEIILSGAKDLYQEIDTSVKASTNRVGVTKAGTTISMLNVDESKIIKNGFVIKSTKTNTDYIFYAF